VSLCPRGRATVDQMLADRRLESAPANPVGAQGLIDKAGGVALEPPERRRRGPWTLSAPEPWGAV